MTISACRGLSCLDLQTMQETPVFYKKEGQRLTATLSFQSAESFVLLETDAASAVRPPRAPEVLSLPSDFHFTSLPENWLTLDTAEISYDGGVTYEPARPVMLLKDLLLRNRYEGEVTLRFTFFAQTVPESLFAVFEPLRYSRISCNGMILQPENAMWRLDRSFRCVDLHKAVHEGENTLEFTFSYWQRPYVYHVLYGGVSESLRNCLSFDTEIECVYLCGAFCVAMPDGEVRWDERESRIYAGTFALCPQKKEIDLRDVVTDGYPFFAGNLSVEATLMWQPEQATALRLSGRYCVCEVSLNGHPVEKSLFSPYVELSEALVPGENRLCLRLYNSNRNLMGPHHFPDPEPYSVGPWTFSCENSWKDERCDAYLPERYSFVRFGLDLPNPEKEA